MTAELGCQENIFFYAMCPSIQQVLYTQHVSGAGLLQRIKDGAVIIACPPLAYLLGGEDKHKESPHHVSWCRVLWRKIKAAEDGQGGWAARSLLSGG